MYDYDFDNKSSETGSGEYSYRGDQVPYGTYAPQGSDSAAGGGGSRPSHSEDRGYVDASYRPRDNGSQSFGSYYTPPQKPKKKREKRKKEKKGGMGFAKVACMCLACALLGGLGGGALVGSMLPEESSGTPGGALTVADGGNAVTTPNISAVPSGSEMTGSEIYALGCEQSVGIQTEMTYNNYFGMATATAVVGSGFIVTENGYVVTNYHVISDAYNNGYDISILLYNGESYPARVVGFREEYDLAVLKADLSGVNAATLGDSESLMVGETVYAIGNPLGELSFSMTTGHVSALDRSITTQDPTTGETTTNVMFQIDAAVNPGNSGGPVYNSRGEVIGIVTAKHSDVGVEGLGFAIPISDVVDIIEQYVSVGYVSGMPSFGITVRTVESVHAAYYNMVEGVYVNSVNEGSCSEAAGIEEGDIITALDGTEVLTTDDLENAKKKYRAGDEVTVTVYRDGEYLELQLVFDEEPVTIDKAGSKGDSLPAVPKQ